MVYLSVVLGVALSVGLFILLPTLLASFIPGLKERAVLRSLIEGVFRILIFLGYMIMISKTPDMKRVFSYHGAEHKTIRCYEAQLPLTVENVRPHDKAPSALRHELPVRRDHHLDSRFRCVQLDFPDQQYIFADALAACNAAVHRSN